MVRLREAAGFEPGRPLLQCGILYDVTRTPRTVVNCYELR
jgi:hypothetical protein